MHHKIKNSPIASLNLYPIYQSIMKNRHQYRWTQKNVNDALELYRLFLYLCWKNPQQRIFATKEIEVVWQAHLSQSQQYQNDCKKIFGKSLDYYKQGLEYRVNISNWLKDYILTLHLLLKET